MPLVPTADLVADAAAARRAVPAFNVITLEHAEAIADGVADWAAGTGGTGAAILQVSQNAVAYHRGQVAPIVAACRLIAEASDARLSVHLDHATERDLLAAAAAAGVSSVMFDASTLPHAENVAATREATAWAQARGLYVEAELGEVGGKDGAHAPGVRTDPDEAHQFVADTGVDALAVAVGSSHAMTERTAALDHPLIERLAAAVDVPLVLHGSSGVPWTELRAAARSGITKINIGTLLNVSFTAAVRTALADERLVDPRKYLTPARTATATVISEAMAELNAAG
ncbi:class II fructose-bisphosphate aldolase [Nakamurella leprariae]|uniref:Class II fructose-bisphosphate aldolase n=1 Tax=Nakamurella leprariae TaxID=2803911 RepID=A0A938YGD4_9ACTN|nr:class II fructose-bisphosphate aldolase [Nakamurella leprariae]MBM9469026.1 class II fructose-bisphosphate aldolase [Nakamurella leprariae]